MTELTRWDINDEFPLAWWVDTAEEAEAKTRDWVARQRGMSLRSVERIERVEHHFLVYIRVVRDLTDVANLRHKPELVANIADRLARRGWQA